jgi:integrase
MAKNILSQDGKGNYKRDLGRTAEGKQPRFYLGRDKAQAEMRAMKLERLWELVEARCEAMRQRHAILEEKWRQEMERGEWQDDMQTLEKSRARWKKLVEGPYWDSVTLEIADAIRKGESVCVLDHREHFKGSVDWEGGEVVVEDDGPDTQLEWLRELQQAFPIVTLKLADEEKYQEGVGKAAGRRRTWQRLADREAKLASPQEDTQRLHAALDAYSEWVGATYRTPPPDSRVKQSGTRLMFHVRKIKEAQEDMPLSAFNLAGIDGMIDHWKNRPLTKKGKPSSPETVKGIIKTIRHFVRWLNRNSNFNWHKPADLEFMPVRITPTPGENARKVRTLQVDTYTRDELATLYRYATGLERLLLLLGLNCGFGQAEIASLQTDEIDLNEKHPYYDLQGSWIRRIRFKTGVYGEWKLWDETVQGVRWMMERRGTQKGGALILTRDGRPLTQPTENNNRNNKIANCWGRLYQRILKDEENKGFRRLSFNKLRKTAGDLIKRVSNGEIAGVFHCRGQVVPTDDLSDLYTNRHFDKVFQAIEAVRQYLGPVFDGVTDPFPKEIKKPALSIGTIRRVKKLLEQGYTQKKVAEMLGISESTVKRYS